MRTKTLLLTAVLTAAGIAAHAQVYSANVVGYVNVVLKGGGAFTLVANPLDAGTNDVTTLGASLPNKSSIQTWNGSGYELSQKVGGVWTTNLAIPVGAGFFVQTPVASGDLTNTFVGEVIVGFGETVTNNLLAGFSLVGGQVPYAGNLADPANVNSLNIGASLPNKSSIQTYDNAGSGAFVLAQKVAGVWTLNTPIAVGQGFFVNAASPTSWVQGLPANP